MYNDSNYQRALFCDLLKCSTSYVRHKQDTWQKLNKTFHVQVVHLDIVFDYAMVFPSSGILMFTNCYAFI